MNIRREQLIRRAALRASLIEALILGGAGLFLLWLTVWIIGATFVVLSTAFVWQRHLDRLELYANDSHS